MSYPSPLDTIVALATGWQAAPLAVVRVSGPDAHRLAASIGAPPPKRTGVHHGATRVDLAGGQPIPATAYWFFAPRSYTGQNLVELHVPGCLPLVRELLSRLTSAGARPALPGEFSARAFQNGKLGPGQVAGVLGLISARSVHAARRAARATAGRPDELLARVRTDLLDLLALVEAGLDFVDEEDIRFIQPPEVLARLDALRTRLAEAARACVQRVSAPLPHVALLGRPSAGKSTLFNALLGQPRALTAPRPGTTRDVLSAPLAGPWGELLLQDCAGLDEARALLDQTAAQASQNAAQRANLVLWVHAANELWTAEERAICQRVAPALRVLVETKVDLPRAAPAPQELSFLARVSVCAPRGEGLALLRDELLRILSAGDAQIEAMPASDLSALTAALERAAAEARQDERTLMRAEAVALELRSALELLSPADRAGETEAVLARIFSQFCVGK